MAGQKLTQMAESGRKIPYLFVGVKVNELKIRDVVGEKTFLQLVANIRNFRIDVIFRTFPKRIHEGYYSRVRTGEIDSNLEYTPTEYSKHIVKGISLSLNSQRQTGEKLKSLIIALILLNKKSIKLWSNY